MDEYLKQFMSSGKTLILDTKTPRKVVKSSKKPSLSAPEALDGSPHDIFVRRTIVEKPKIKDLVKEFGRFIVMAEADL